MTLSTKIFYWARVVCWCGMIFYFSSIPNLRTELGIWDFILRKLAHMFVFGILFLFVHSAIVSTYNLEIKKTYLYSVIFCIIYAISDEYHQSFVPGRDGNALDVLIDSAGILMAMLLKRKLTKNNNTLSDKQ